MSRRHDVPRRSRLRPERSWAALALSALALGIAACGSPMPYRAMARAASSEENVFSQAEDKRMGLAVRETLGANQGLHGLEISPFVYMGRVFLVGFVSTEGQAQQAVEAVRGLAGVRSVDSYLPVSPGGSTGEAAERKARDTAITGEVKGALGLDPDEVITRIDVKTLAGHVVLLLPEPGFERLRPGLR